MSALEYSEVACARCGSLNRRYRHGILADGDHSERCDHCGADLATGRVSLAARLDRFKKIALSYVLCGFAGAVAVGIPLLFVAWALLPARTYDLHRPVIANSFLAVGVVLGLLVAERNRRRDGLFPKRVAQGSAQSREPDKEIVQVDLTPAAHQSVMNQKARYMLYLGAYAVSIPCGLLVSRVFSLDLEATIGTMMVLAIVAAWLFGRMRLPVSSR